MKIFWKQLSFKTRQVMAKKFETIPGGFSMKLTSDSIVDELTFMIVNLNN